MDRNYYYRILGLRSGATQAQIRKAYNDRIAKLSLPDYSDDPEYAHRKKQQATMAYKVLIGSVPSPTKQQKENGYERFKDSLEAKEGSRGIDTDSLEELISKFAEKIRGSLPTSKGKARDKKAVKVNGQGVVWIVAIVVCVMVLITGLSGNTGNEYTYGGSGNGTEVEEIWEEAEYAYDTMLYVDYKQNLDMSTMVDNRDDIVWDEGEGVYGESEVHEATLDLLYALDIYDADEFYDYITGEENYYYDNDDLTCAQMLIGWISAPDFAQVAGGTSDFTGEPILDMEDYLRYLEEIAYYEI